MDDAERVHALLATDRSATDTYSADGWTPLHLAAFFGAHRAAQLLLTHGADPRRISRNSMANTPLHAALAGKHASVVKILLDGGADPRLECQGYTPLAIAEGGAFHEGATLVREALATGATS